MNSALQFSLTAIFLTFVWLLWSTRDVGLKEWSKSADAPGIWKGIGIVLGVSILIALLTGCTTNGTYFNDASIYAGLDYTKNVSPQCEQGGADDRTTSNVGLRGNVYQSDDERFRLNGKYTHHSCAFSPDRHSYDAIGAEVEFRFYERR